MDEFKKREELLKEMGPPESTFDSTPSEIARTIRTSNITMVTDQISVFVNEYGQQTPMLIVAICKLDSTEYAALFDTTTGKAYSVEVVRENGIIKFFKDLDGIGQDEEWGVVTTFFQQNNVFEQNRIRTWLWNTKTSASLGGAIPKSRLKRIK